MLPPTPRRPASHPASPATATRSIPAVHRGLLVLARELLLGGLLLVLGGLVLAQLVLPAADGAPRPKAAVRPTVYGTLLSLQRSGALSAEAYGEDSSTYTEALRVVK